MIQELLTKDLFISNLEAASKAEAINKMIDVLDQNDKLIDKAKYTKAVFDREDEFSTGIGMGVAIPHGKSDGVKTPSLVFARSKDGIDFESMDDEPAFLFFLVAVPEAGGDEHLKILSTLSRKLMHKSTRDDLMNATSYEEIVSILG